MNNKPNALAVVRRMLLIAVFFSTTIFISCSSPTHPSDGNGAVTQKNPYYPLALGNIWYYNFYEANRPIDTTKFNSTWQIISTKSLGTKVFYGLKRVSYGSDTTIITEVDTVYISISNDSLFQINPNLPFSESSIHLQAVLCDSGFATFTWTANGDTYQGDLVDRTDTTITFSYWNPGWMDSGYNITYKKGVGQYDSQSGWGLGSRLVKYHLNK
jgi:hypothetical protein